jgi:cell wall-associated NlpC family hydrolase
MSFSASEAVERARSLVGVPFRPQGRHPKSGLDCAGVVLWTFSIAAQAARRNYRLRGFYLGEIRATLSTWFEEVAEGKASVGDVLLFAIRDDQAHLAVSCGDSFVHANAALRRVVETPMTAGWTLAAAFRSRKLL